MSFKTVITSAAVSAIAAGSLIPLSSAANARDWNRGGEHARYVEPFDRDGGERVNRWGEQRRDYGWHRAEVVQDEDYTPRHHRDNTGRNVAIGVFAAMLGLAIASEAGHAHNYDDRD